jgi:hypothetical protein
MTIIESSAAELDPVAAVTLTIARATAFKAAETVKKCATLKNTFNFQCGESNNIGQCGENTKLENGICVVDIVQCGENTKLENGICVVDMSCSTYKEQFNSKDCCRASQ